jgi:hypothetical protein
MTKNKTYNMVKIKVKKGNNEHVLGYMDTNLYKDIWGALEILVHKKGYDSLSGPDIK